MGVTVTLWAAGASPGEETQTKCSDRMINRDKIKGDTELELEGSVDGPRWKLGRVWLGQDRLGKEAQWEEQHPCELSNINVI